MKSQRVREPVHSCCGNIQRRLFLADCGMGFTGLVLGSMLHGDGIVRAGSPEAWTPGRKPHFAAKAKHVIWLFMLGGVSHMESFDPKPELNKYAGKTIDESPYKDVLESPFGKKNVRRFNQTAKRTWQTIFPLQIGYRKRGQSGIEMSDWWPHLGECIDDIAVIRSMWTTDNNHGAQLQFHTGRHIFDGVFPSIGSWVHYGLGCVNENLPAFVVLGEGVGTCCGGSGAIGGSYLGPEHSGVKLAGDPENPLPFAFPGSGVYKLEQANEFQFQERLNRLAGVKYPDDPALRARIKSYELAFRMQSTVPEVFRFSEESAATRKLYGLDQEETRSFGERCLTARRLVERGTRFVQVFHGIWPFYSWDAHSDLKKKHSKTCGQVDQPIAGLLKDLKQRGLLEETLVVFGTEFGRTPAVEGGEGQLGRDHHPLGFSVWMAGGGIKGGVAHGATDELGYHAVENRHYVTDIHATVLHQLGLDSHRLQVPGHKRLEIDYGKVIHDIIA